MANFLKLASLLVLAVACQGLDEESAKEQQCFPITDAMKTKFDMAWYTSVKKFYLPLLTRLDLYRLAQEHIGKDMKDITEAEVYYDACFETSTVEGGFISRGLNGLKQKYNLKPLDSEMKSFNFSTQDGKGHPGTCHTTMTDNKSFIFFTCCFSDNQMAWDVISTEKTLPKETVDRIHEHALSLGFKKEYFTSLRYDYCKTE